MPYQNLPADCQHCYFLGKQKYGLDHVCFFSGSTCAKKANVEAGKLKLSISGSEVLQIWSMTQTQWNVSMSGLVGLNYQSVDMVAKILEIELTAYHLNLIRSLEAATLEHYRKESEAKK